MASENNVQVDLYLNTAPAEKAVEEFSAKAVSSGEKLGEKVGGSISGGLERSLKKLAGLAAAYLAFDKIKDSVVSAANAAIENEKAVKQMNSALALSGEYSKSASLELQNFASRIQMATGVSDEAIMGMISYAKSLGATNEQAKKISETAINMSKVLGTDAQSNVEQLTKSLNNGAGKLAAYDSHIKGLTDSQLKAGAAVDLLANKFAGGAQASLMGFAGGLTRMKVGFDELLEKVGAMITKSPILGAIVNKLANWFFDLGTSIKGLTKGGDPFKKLTVSIVEFGMMFNKWIIMPFEIAYNVGRAFFSGIVNGLNVIVAGFGQLGGVVAKLLEGLGMENTFTQNLKTFADSSKQVMIESATSFGESLSSITDTSLTESLDARLTEVKTFAENVKAVHKDMSNGIKENNRITSSEIELDAQRLNDAIKNSLVNSLSSASQKIGTALAKGGLAFKDFRNIALEMIGDMAIMVGQAVMAMAITIGIFKKSIIASPYAAVAAAAGLIALGAMIKAYAGKSGAGADAGGGVAAGSEAASSVVSDSIASDTTREKQEPKAVVNLTVNGDVLDSDASGLRIAQLLEDAVNKQGVIVRGLA